MRTMILVAASLAAFTGAAVAPRNGGFLWLIGCLAALYTVKRSWRTPPRGRTDGAEEQETDGEQREAR